MIARRDWTLPGFAGLAAAVAATRCGYWQRAIGLWRDQLRSPAAARLAAVGAAEAGLRSGRFDLAAQMLGRLAEPPAHLRALAAECDPLRSARKAWFAERLEAAPKPPGLARAERLVGLALHREALREIAASGEHGTALAVQALSGLGEHDRVLALVARADDPAVARAAEAAREAAACLAEPLAEQLAAFLASHPAGEAFAETLDALGTPA